MELARGLLGCKKPVDNTCSELRNRQGGKQKGRKIPLLLNEAGAEGLASTCGLLVRTPAKPPVIGRAGWGLSPEHGLRGGPEQSSAPLEEGQREGQGHTGPNFQPALLLAWEGEVRGAGQELALEWRKPLEGEGVQRFSGRFAASADELSFPGACGCFPPPTLRTGLGSHGSKTQSSDSCRPLASEVNRVVSASRRGPSTRLSGRHQEDRGPVCSSSGCRGQPQVTQ